MTYLTLDPEKQPVIEQRDVFKEWRERERVIVHSDIFTINTRKCEVGPWPRKGDSVKGAFLEVSGACPYQVVELPPGGSTDPQRQMCDEAIYILWGHGSTTVWQEGAKQTFEWGPNSYFYIPTNAQNQFFNGSLSESTRWLVATDLQTIMRTFGEDFVFNNPFDFRDRFSGESEFLSRAKLYRGRVWETNFIPDLKKLPVWDWVSRGAGQNAFMTMGGGTKEGHVSVIPAGCYKQAHAHPGGGGRGPSHPTIGGGAGGHFVVQGRGYTLVKPTAKIGYDFETVDWEKMPFRRINWEEGSIYHYGFPGYYPLHQHFSPDKVPNIYLNMNQGLPRNWARTRWTANERTDVRPHEGSRAEGGGNVLYSEEPPEIHQEFEEECRKNGTVCKMKKWHPLCTGEYE